MDVLGPEPEDKAQPRTNVHVVRGLHATTDQKHCRPSLGSKGALQVESTGGRSFFMAIDCPITPVLLRVKKGACHVWRINSRTVNTV